MLKPLEFRGNEMGTIGTMLTGVAIGGPRNNVKLTAAYNWDGFIWILGEKTSSYRTKRHAGQYIWNGINWVWYELDDTTPSSEGKAPDPRK